MQLSEKYDWWVTVTPIVTVLVHRVSELMLEEKVANLNRQLFEDAESLYLKTFFFGTTILFSAWTATH